MKKRLLLSCLSISTIVFLSCTMSPPNTVLIDKNQQNNVIKNTKSFSTKGINSIKVPNVPKDLYFNNDYHANTPNKIISSISQRLKRKFGYNCDNYSNIPCDGVYYPEPGFSPFEGLTSAVLSLYASDNGLMHVNALGVTVWGKNTNITSTEIGKEYEIPTNLTYDSAYGKLYLRFDKQREDLVRFNVIGEDLESPITETYYRQGDFQQIKYEYVKVYSEFSTTYDEITLNIDKTELTSDSEKSLASISSNSDTRAWTLEIEGQNYSKKYHGVGNSNITIPDENLPEGQYFVFLYYDDQTLQRVGDLINKTIATDNPYITDNEYSPYGQNVNYNSLKFSTKSNTDSCN
jgi:hypothetical protein